jgi:ABC-2 type transport system permease protein
MRLLSPSLLETLLRLLHLCRKELVSVFMDPASRSVLILPPLLQALLFGYAATFDLNQVPYAVVDQSHGPHVRQLLDRLDGSGQFLLKARPATPALTEALISAGEVVLVIQFPPDFENRLAAGQPAPVMLILDGRNSRPS